MNKDNLRPVSSIKHDDKRAAIPDSAHQGEEQMAISGSPEWSEYQVFRHDFQRGRDPELYWLGKYKNDDELTSAVCISMKTSALRPSSTVSTNCTSIRARVPSCNSTSLAT